MRNAFNVGLIFGLGLAGTSVDASAAKCDRACLDKTVDTYIAAMVAHDPSQVAFAADVKFVENTVPMKPGEGLWKTASEGPTTFKIYVPDPVAQQVGFLCMMKEHDKDADKPIQLGLRLKLKNGKITEAEHLIARDLRENSLKNLETPRPGLLAAVPPGRAHAARQDAEDRRVLLHGAGDRRQQQRAVCRRLPAPRKRNADHRQSAFENARAGNHGRHGLRRRNLRPTRSTTSRGSSPGGYEIADPETGLVFGLSQFRQPMEKNYVKIVGVPGLGKDRHAFQAVRSAGRAHFQDPGR